MVSARVDDASAQSGGDAADAEAVARRADVSPDPPELLHDPSIRSDSFDAQLVGAAHDGLASRVTGRDGEQRQLVDQRGTSDAFTVAPTSSEERTSTSPAGSPPIEPAVVDRDPRAHALEDVEQTRSPRVEADAVNRTDEPGTIAAATRKGAADEMSPGTSSSGSRRRSAGCTVTLVGAARDPGAGALQQPLRVIPGRSRLYDGRVALGEKAAKSRPT